MSSEARDRTILGDFKMGPDGRSRYIISNQSMNILSLKNFMNSCGVT